VSPLWATTSPPHSRHRPRAALLGVTSWIVQLVAASSSLFRAQMIYGLSVRFVFIMLIEIFFTNLERCCHASTCYLHCPFWPSVLPHLHLHPSRLHRHSCNLYFDTTSSTPTIISYIDTLPPHPSSHQDHLEDLLCWSPPTLAYGRDGLYLCVRYWQHDGV
jgi:hypothetical protein